MRQRATFEWRMIAIPCLWLCIHAFLLRRGAAFNSEPAYFTFISELMSLFVDEYTVEGSALKYEFVFEGVNGRGRVSCKVCAAPRRIVLLLSSSFGHTRILCKPLQGTTFIAVIHGDSVSPWLHIQFMSLSCSLFFSMSLFFLLSIVISSSFLYNRSL